MRVFHVATECATVVSVGGLGDVVFQIAKQGALEGLDTTVILPRYGQLDRDFQSRFGGEIARKIANAAPVPVRLAFPGKIDPVAHDQEIVRFAEVNLSVGPAAIKLCFVDAQRFSRRQQAYGRPAYVDFYPINLLLQKAALKWIASQTSAGNPAVIHGHDAHVGTLPLLARQSDLFQPHLAGCTFVTTAHNCGWGLRQRLWMKHLETEKKFLAAAFDVDWETIAQCLVEDGEIPMPGFEPFAAAALFGDYLTFVSEGYCWEILQGGKSETAECDREILAFAKYLDEQRRAGALRAQIKGITNGIDPGEVGPEALPPEVGLPAETRADFAWKPAFRSGFFGRLQNLSARPRYWNEIKVVQGHLDAVDPNDCVLFTCIGRPDRQKGMDLLARAVEETFVFHERAALCLLGGGELPELQEVAKRFPGRVVILDGRSENVAKEIYAAGDFFLIPSRFEPCGLIDFRAQLNGNIPLANQVGGLTKIIHGQTGFGFFGLGDRTILRGLVHAIHEAMQLHTNPAARFAMMQNADAWVRRHHTWRNVFPAFRELYAAGPRLSAGS